MKTLKKTSFFEQCYNLVRQVPEGRVTTYKAICEAMGSHAYRAVGQAMHRNPYAPEVPCHRVVSSDGSLGGFAWGSEKKIALLSQEGIQVQNNAIIDFETHFFNQFDF